MSKPPFPVSRPQTPATTGTPSISSSNIEGIFDAALKSYRKKTKKDLKNHNLFKQLESCDSPAAILAVFQAAQFDQTGADDRLKKWLVPTIKVLCAFSDALGEGVSLVFPPAKAVFAGVGVLLLLKVLLRAKISSSTCSNALKVSSCGSRFMLRSR
jgi:hypothetical protein